MTNQLVRCHGGWWGWGRKQTTRSHQCDRKAKVANLQVGHEAGGRRRRSRPVRRSLLMMSDTVASRARRRHPTNVAGAAIANTCQPSTPPPPDERRWRRHRQHRTTGSTRKKTTTPASQQARRRCGVRRCSFVVSASLSAAKTPTRSTRVLDGLATHCIQYYPSIIWAMANHGRP